MQKTFAKQRPPAAWRTSVGISRLLLERFVATLGTEWQRGLI